jgi:pseudouridine synthase
MEQLQQLLARAGVGSRRRCAELVKSGRVTVNRSVILHPGLRIDPTRDRVRLDGRPVEPAPGELHLMLHKPAGYLSARSDPRGRRTVMALLDPALARRVYPVGRLDRDATGLLLLTNDGELAHRLMHPRYHVPRAYEVDVEGEPSRESLDRLTAGLELEDGMTAPARVKVHKLSRQGSRLKLTLREGRKNQVKRMLAAVGHPVRQLRRVSFGSLHLGHMPVGTHRALRPAEVEALREAVGLTGTAEEE